MPAAKDFESRLGALGTVGKNGNTRPDLHLDVPGSTVPGRHLHHSMRGHLVISATPWLGVSHANGVVCIEGLPEGKVELTLWQAEQFAKQPSLRPEAGNFTSAQARQSLTPRGRRN